MCSLLCYLPYIFYRRFMNFRGPMRPIGSDNSDNTNDYYVMK
jgi:hypothetical protein